MLPQKWLMVLVIAGTTTALTSVPRQTIGESLNSALDAITRKQMSLDANSQDYYNNLQAYEYRGGEEVRKFDRERTDDNVQEENEEVEFLPNETGQLETVGNGFQDLNNKLLETALINYLEDMSQQEQPVTSLFRERERSTNRKRSPERLNVDNKELVKLFLEELQDSAPYNLQEVGNEGYMDTRQMLYDTYREDRGDKFYEGGSPMSWGELMNKETVLRGQDRETDKNEFIDRDQDPNLLYSTLAERRNVNGRYPIGRDLGTYRRMTKRYPVAKRSPKPMPIKNQVTDPKVAQDLGSLFGAKSTDNQNNTHSHNHEHEHEHEHEHDRGHSYKHGDQHKHESSSVDPKVSPPSKSQKENVTKFTKSKSIEVRKKSVDWSQYFGIDRRKKKGNFVAGQGTQNQDDEWMLQRYYENMIEKLKTNDRDYGRKDKLEQIDTKQKNIKDLFVEEALRSANSEDSVYLQKVKDKMMARIAAAYSLEKIRNTLNEMKNNVAARIEAQNMAHSQNNRTSNFRENNYIAEAGDKHTRNSIGGDEVVEKNRVCLELEAIEKRCRTADRLAGDESQILYLPCVMLQICKACISDELEEECLSNYAVEAGKICDDQEIREGQRGREACASTAVILSQLQPTAAVSMQCHINGNESCLRRYHYQYWHRYFRYPYGGRRLNNGYDTIGPQRTDR